MRRVRATRRPTEAERQWGGAGLRLAKRQSEEGLAQPQPRWTRAGVEEAGG